MITVTIGEAVRFAPALQRLMDRHLPAKVALRFARIASKLQPELSEYEKKRAEIIKEHGTPGTEPDSYLIPPESTQVVNDKLADMASETINVDVEPISVDMLGDALVTPIDMLVLDKVIV